MKAVEGWYDIHNHMLPEVDDGAADWNETQKMLQLAYEEGVRNIILTPHYHRKYYHVSNEIIKTKFEKFKELTHSIDGSMKVYLGNELYYHHDATVDLKNEKVYTMAESSYILVEFSPTKDSNYISNALNTLQMEGYLPILAHAERYRCYIKDWKQIIDLVERGVYIQLNASSIIGKSGFTSKRFTKRLLEQDLVHFVATDTHDIHKRPPLLRKCVQYIEKRYGQDRVDLLFCNNPQCIIENKSI